MGLPPVAWLSDPDIAIWSAVLANVWRGTAFSMILLYAGLLVIPRSLYEAAAVDGATAFRQFLLHHPAAAPADPADQHHPDQHLHAQQLRPDPAADRRRPGPRDRGAFALRLQHRLPELRPLERRGARGHPAADQPRLHLLLRPAAAEGDLTVSAVPTTPASPTSAPMSAYCRDLPVSSPGRFSGSSRCRSAPRPRSTSATSASGRGRRRWRTTARRSATRSSQLPLERAEARGRRGASARCSSPPRRPTRSRASSSATQPGDDRPSRLPDDLAAGDHGAALPLHGPGRAHRQPLRRRAASTSRSPRRSSPGC